MSNLVSLLTPDTSPQGEDVPFMTEANLHQLSYNGTDLRDSTSWGDFGSAAAATAVRAVASTINGVANIATLGQMDDPEIVKTEGVLRTLDDNLADYYVAHQEGIDIAGDVLGTFVPGIGGTKVMRWGLKALESVPKGTWGATIANKIGALPDAHIGYLSKAKAELSATDTPYKLLNSNALKAVGTAYAASALEVAAYETAAVAAQGKFSPMYEDYELSDLASNALYGGGLIGAGITSVTVAGKIWGGLRQAVREHEAILAPFRTSTRMKDENSFAQLMANYHDIASMPAVTDVTESAARDKITRVHTENRKILQSMTDDISASNTLADYLETLSPTDALNRIAYLKSVNKAGSVAAGDLFGFGAKQAAQAPRKADAFIHMWGENKGLTADAPIYNWAADTRSAEQLKKDLAQFNLKSQLSATEYNSVEQAQLYNIWASELKASDIQKAVIRDDNLAVLERAYDLGIQVTTPSGVLSDAALLNRIKDLKDEGKVMLTSRADSQFGSDKIRDICERLNITQDYFNTGAVEGFNAFKAYGVKDLRAPRSLHLTYDMPDAAWNNGNFITAQAWLENQRAVEKTAAMQATAGILGGEDVVPQIRDAQIKAASAIDRQTGYVSSANGNHNSLTQMMQFIGSQINRLGIKAAESRGSIFTSRANALLVDSAAGTEFNIIAHKLQSSGIKWTLAGDRIIPMPLAKWEAEQAAIKAGTLAASDAKYKFSQEAIDSMRDNSIAIKNKATQEFLDSWHQYNSAHVDKLNQIHQFNGKELLDNSELYIPPPLLTKDTHYAIVKDDSLLGQGKTRMIWAKSASDLAAMREAVLAKSPTAKVLTKDASKLWHEALGDYERDRVLNTLAYDSSIGRTGDAAPYFPNMDTEALLHDLMQWRSQADEHLIRSAAITRNRHAFDELALRAKEYHELNNSKVSFGDAVVDKVGTNPFLDYINLGLDKSAKSRVAVLSELNSIAERGYQWAHDMTIGAWKEAAKVKDWEGKLDTVNAALQSAGIHFGLPSAEIARMASKTVDSNALSRIINKFNGVLATVVLRSDPLQALNNAAGMTIMNTPEFKSLLDGIKASNPELAGAMSHVTLPTGDQAVSVQKLYANALKDWWGVVTDNPESKAMFDRYKELGWIKSHTEQAKELFSHYVFEPNQSWLTKAEAKLSDAAAFAEKVTGNKFAEEMNRFVTAHMGDSLTKLGVEAGALSQGEANAMINTLINRAHGVYVASQRPFIFQGALGQAVGLFQTYQFNMMQQFFRHITDGTAKNSLLMMGLQGTIYGAQSMPGFQAMNQILVANAAGNTSKNDVYSQTAALFGTKGDWLMYGGLSNFPKLLGMDGIGMYSRGDINPRQVTILPVSPADVPFIQSTGKFYTGLKEMYTKAEAGVPVWDSILQGLEHMNISRPLAGMATLIEGNATTTKGDLISSFDHWQASQWVRALGARPLDEAIKRDEMSRQYVYSSNRAAEIGEIGSSVKAKLTAGQELTQEDMGRFLHDYVKAGGTQQHFNQFIAKQIKGASESRIDNIRNSLTNPYAWRMQVMMGGQ